MKNKFLIIFMVYLSTMFVGCESYVEGLDKSPNDFANAAPELVVAQTQLAWFMTSGADLVRVAGIFTNQFTGSDRQYVALNEFQVKRQDMNGYWADLYHEGIAQALIVIEKAEAASNKELAGITKISLAGLLGNATSLFGDVPYTEANKYEEYSNPVYDDQMSVYAAIQGLLDQAISDVGDASTERFSGNRIVASISSWAEIAHSLKARYYLHTGDYDKALAESKLGIKDASGDLLINTPGTAPENRNLFYQFIVDERDGYLTADDSYLTKLINNDDSTVTRLLDTPGEEERFDHYFTVSEDVESLNTETGGVFAIDASFPIISWNEIKLIEAESSYREGDETSATAALNAVRAKLAFDYGAVFPATTSTGDTLLKEILEEKYITLMGQLEVWNDVRRTDNLLKIPQRKKEGSEGIPQRMLYPQSEIDSNSSIPNPLPGLYDKTKVNKGTM